MIDSRSRPDPIAYLDQVAVSPPGRAYKRQVLDLLDLRPGQRVLDLGCGPGTDLAAMAGLVAPDGLVVGVDRARTDRVLQHVEDPSRVLAEFRRVARPGGRIVLAEPDWEGLLIDSREPAVGRELTRFIATERVRNVARAIDAGRLDADAERWIEDVAAGPFLATALLFLVAAEVTHGADVLIGEGSGG